MENPEAFTIIQFAVPMYTALICALLLFRMYYRDESPMGRKNIKWAILAYLLSVLVWLSITLYIALSVVYTLISPFILLLSMSVHVMYYRFIFELTRVNNKERFSWVHSVLPTLAFIILAIGSYFVPFDVQLRLVGSGEVYADHYRLYSILFLSKPFLYFIYDIIYASLGLSRTIRFRRVIINYSADEQRISFIWLYQFLFIMLVALPMTVVVLFLPNSFIIASGIALFPVCIATVKDIILAHNVLLENYVIIKPDNNQPKKEELRELIAETIPVDHIQQLENYMRERKPYLNPRLKITDITTELNTNRTSLSILINRSFGMNFNRYVNRYRLEELERLKNDPGCSAWCEMDLVAMAGFSDYRGYKRVKQREEIEIDV